MANNRLYIGCGCGETFFLGKYYPFSWEVGSWTDDFDKKLNKWLFDHRHAHGDDAQWGEKDGHAPWMLLTENQIGDPMTKEKRRVINAITEKKDG